MNSGKSNQIDVNPLNQGGALYDPPPCFGFFPLLKISLRNLYLAKLFVADAHCTNEKKIQHFCFTPSQSNFKYGSENRPWLRGLIIKLFLQYLLSKYYVLNFFSTFMSKKNIEGQLFKEEKNL